MMKKRIYLFISIIVGMAMSMSAYAQEKPTKKSESAAYKTLGVLNPKGLIIKKIKSPK
jgi:hypothetical protein